MCLFPQEFLHKLVQVGAGRTADVRAEVGAPGPLWGGEGRAAADWRRGSVRQRAALSWLLPNRSPICPHSLFRSLTATDRPGSRVTPRGVAAAGEGRAAGLGAEEIECTLPSICCSIPPQAQIEAHTLEECQQLERGVLRALEAAAHLQLAHEAEVAARKQGAAPGGAAQQQQPGCEATAAAAAAAAVAAGKEEAEGEEGGGKKDSKKAKDKSVALAVAAWAKAETGDEPPAVQQVCGGGAWAGLSAVGSSQSVEAQRRGAPPRCTLLLATAPYHMPRRCTVPPHLPSRPPPPPPPSLHCLPPRVQALRTKQCTDWLGAMPVRSLHSLKQRKALAAWVAAGDAEQERSPGAGRALPWCACGCWRGGGAVGSRLRPGLVDAPRVLHCTLVSALPACAASPLQYL